MRFGLAIFPTEEALPPDELARLAEDRGFESLFFTEHSHIPAIRESRLDPGDPYYDTSGQDELGREYSRTFDPFVSLSLASGATDELRLGTGICLVVQRDPIHTAKSVASLDYLSGGRVLFGVGAGWNHEEMQNHGTDPRTRFARMRESVEAMKVIWTQDEASYDGEFVQFERIWAWPKPVQRPHPPVLIGGNGPRVIDRVLAFGDEWLPEPSKDLPSRLDELQSRARATGRPDGIPVTVYGAHTESVSAYARFGVHRCVFWLPPRHPADIRRRLDEIAIELGLC